MVERVQTKYVRHRYKIEPVLDGIKTHLFSLHKKGKQQNEFLCGFQEALLQ